MNGGGPEKEPQTINTASGACRYYYCYYQALGNQYQIKPFQSS